MTRFSMHSQVAVAEYVDRVCAIEMRSSRFKPGALVKLYDRARCLQGLPLTLLAAHRLAQTVRPGDYVLITTGIGHPDTLPRGETDGPPGAAAIARCVSQFFQAIPVIVAGEDYLAPILASCQALGLEVSDRARETAVLSEAIPLEDGDTRQKSSQLVEEYQPSALISVEALGPNSKGVFHSLGGFDWTASNVPFHHLYDRASADSILTLGVGDGGNEIGCGLIYDSVRAIVEYGSTCRCPCGAGVATTTATDVLVLAGISNWGVYGIEAGLALLRRDPAVLHSPEAEERSLRACIAAGARDGPTGTDAIMVDAVPLETHQALLVLLRTIVRKYVE